MKKYQYEVIRKSRGVLELIGPLEGIREAVIKDPDPRGDGEIHLPSYPYCQVLNGKIVAAFRREEIYDTDDALGVGL